MYKITIFSIYLVPIVDTLTGFLIRYELLSLGRIYKSFLMILMFYQILKRSRVESVLIFIPMIYVNLIALSHNFFLYTSLEDVLIDLNWIIKFSFWIICFFFFYTVFKDDIRTIYRISIFFFFVYFINLLLGTMGIGFKQYYITEDKAIGSLGFIYAGNELSIALSLLEVVILSIVIYNKNFTKFCAFFLLFLVASMLKTTKVFLVSVFIIPLFILFFYSIRNKACLIKFQKRAFILLVVYIIVLPALVLLNVYILLNYIGLLYRIQYWLEHTDFLTFLLSSRNLFAEAIIRYMCDAASVTHLVLGFGNPKLYGLKSAEMDFIDFVFSYGMSGLAFVFFYFIIFISKGLNITSEVWFKRTYILTCIYILTISAIAGHVINSTYASITFGLLAGLLRVFQKRDTKKL